MFWDPLSPTVGWDLEFTLWSRSANQRGSGYLTIAFTWYFLLTNNVAF